jgi:hypothetical protein
MPHTLTDSDLTAIAEVVARMSRGRGSWFDAEAEALRIAKVAQRNEDIRERVHTIAKRIHDRMKVD